VFLGILSVRDVPWWARTIATRMGDFKTSRDDNRRCDNMRRELVGKFASKALEIELTAPAGAV
jgi:hypothetical protein